MLNYSQIFRFKRKFPDYKNVIMETNMYMFIVPTRVIMDKFDHIIKQL